MARRKKQRVDVSRPDAGEGLGALAAALSAAGFEAPDATPSKTPDAAATPARPRPAAPGKVVLRRERKGRGGRTVTLVEGLGGDLEQQARALRKSLGCGARVEGGQVVVQGDVGDRIEAWLRAQGVTRIVRGN